jgi:hypothetical protein
METMGKRHHFNDRQQANEASEPTAHSRFVLNQPLAFAVAPL